MKRIHKILFPVDFSSHYETLVPWVHTFADKFEATVYVLFVTEDLSHFSTFYVPHGNIESFQKEAVAAAKKKMVAVVQEHFKVFPKLETRVEIGIPGAKILEVATREGIDLIIMGAHGHKGLDRAIFGSTADKVVQSAHCPVLTVHP